MGFYKCLFYTFLLFAGNKTALAQEFIFGQDGVKIDISTFPPKVDTSMANEFIAFFKQNNSVGRPFFQSFLLNECGDSVAFSFARAFAFDKKHKVMWNNEYDTNYSYSAFALKNNTQKYAMSFNNRSDFNYFNKSNPRDTSIFNDIIKIGDSLGTPMAIPNQNLLITFHTFNPLNNDLLPLDTLLYFRIDQDSLQAPIKKKRTYKAHFNQMIFSPNGKKLLSVFEGKKLYLYDFDPVNLTYTNEQLVFDINTFETPINAPKYDIHDFCFSANGENIYFYETTLQIFDLNGKQMIKRDWSNNQNLSISTKNWPVGVYILQLNGAEIELSRKLLVNH